MIPDVGTCLNSARHLHQLAEVLEESGPPDAWLAAGCVVQSIWNLLTGRNPALGILDYDIVYFDPDVSEAAEVQWRSRLQSGFPDLRLDVKNQARVHLWYPRRFGITIPPFDSVEAAMRTWPTTATATAARRKQGEWEILAPFGTTDLMNLILRPNRVLATEAVYSAKLARWQVLWPELNVLPWEQGLGQPQIGRPVDL